MSLCACAQYFVWGFCFSFDQLIKKYKKGLENSQVQHLAIGIMTNTLLTLLSLALFGMAYANKDTITRKEFDTKIGEVLTKLSELSELKNRIEVLEKINKIDTKMADTVEERLEKLEQLSKLHHARSCFELAQHGISKSGTYTIDPDGHLIGQPPVDVICDFNQGTTEVSHDKESEVVIGHCLEIGCAKYHLKYQAPMEQIQALIELSDRCYQSISFGCFLSPLNDDGVNLGWWLDKSGKSK